MRTVLVMLAALAAAGCLHRNPDAPTTAQVGAGVRDCTACVQEVSPIVTAIFSRCGAPADAGVD